MTAALAWADRDRSYVAVDGRMTCGGNVVGNGAKKLISVGGWTVACCGCARWSTLLDAAIARDRVPSLATVYDLMDFVKTLLSEDDWGRGENAGSRVYPEFSALVIGWSGAYEIGCDLSVITAASEDVLFAGSGGELAVGAFRALREHASHLSSDQAAEIAIEIAGQVDTSTGGRATVMSTAIERGPRAAREEPSYGPLGW